MKTPKLRITGFCVWNSPVTGEFPAQMASNAENVSIWWRHHGVCSSISLGNNLILFNSLVPLTPYNVRKLDQQWSRQWLVAWRRQTLRLTNIDFYQDMKIASITMRCDEDIENGF